MDDEAQPQAETPPPEEADFEDNPSQKHKTELEVGRGEPVPRPTRTGGGGESGGDPKLVPLGVALFATLGLALLYPYNAIIACSDWFAHALPDVPNVAGLLANANFSASLITTFLILAFASPKEAKEEEEEGGEEAVEPSSFTYSIASWTSFVSSISCVTCTHLTLRIYVGFFFEGAPLLAFALFVPTRAQAVALSFLVGIGDALAQSGIFPLAGNVHARCTAAASLGSAVAGLIAGLLRLLTKAAFPSTDEGMRLSSSVYFGIAAFVIVLCTLALYAICRIQEHLIVAFVEPEYEGMCKSHKLRLDSIQKSYNLAGVGSLREGSQEDEVEDAYAENERGVERTAEPSDEGNKSNVVAAFLRATDVYRVALRCAWLPISVQFVNFVITLSLFPGLVTSMQSEALGTWLPVILVTVFNAGDTLGRLLQLSKPVERWIVTPVGEDILHPTTGEHIGNRRPRMKYSIVLPCVLRLAFYPLLLFCVNPLYIRSDALRIVIVLFFAMSSGWVFSCCFMLCPELCKEPKHREAASLLIIVSTLISLGVGSSVGLGIHGAVVGNS